MSLIRLTYRYCKYLLNKHRLGDIYCTCSWWRHGACALKQRNTSAVPSESCAVNGRSGVHAQKWHYCSSSHLHSRSPQTWKGRPGKDESTFSSDIAPREGILAHYDFALQVWKKKTPSGLLQLKKSLSTMLLIDRQQLSIVRLKQEVLLLAESPGEKKLWHKITKKFFLKKTVYREAWCNIYQK